MVSHQTLRRLIYFAGIAEAGSIRGAAARLNLSVPVLSEALSELEAELGVSLAARTTRHFELTQAGIRTQAVAKEILDRAEALTDLTPNERPLEGTLSLTVPAEIAGFWLPQKIKAFKAKHRQVTFDVDVADRVVDLRAGTIEMSIRAEYVSPGEQSRSAINLPLVVVASRSVPVGPDGIVDLPLIDSKADRMLVATSRDDGSLLSLKFLQTDKVTNRLAGLQMARSGIGAVMVMRGSVAADLEQGDLVEILPDHEFGSIDLKCHFRDCLPSALCQTFARETGLERA